MKKLIILSTLLLLYVIGYSQDIFRNGLTSYKDINLLYGAKLNSKSTTITGLLNTGTSSAKYIVSTGANVWGIYARDTVCTGYTDGVSVGLYANRGDGSGALRPIQAFSYADSAANISELYGGSFYATQENNSIVASNIYAVMGWTTINETGATHDPVGYITGLMGIYSTPGIDPTVSFGNPGFKAAIGAVVKDSPNTSPDAAVMAFAEGDNGTGIAINAAFKAVSVRSASGDGFNYGIDFKDEAGYGTTIQTADIRGTNSETIDNLTNGTWNLGTSNVVATSYNFANATAVAGTGDAITIDFIPNLPALTAGLTITFVAEAANTTTVTLAIDGGTAKAVFESADASALEANDIRSGTVQTLVYDGTQWQQTSQSGN